MPTWKFLRGILAYRPFIYLLLVVQRSLIFMVAPLLSGLIVRAFFDRLSGQAEVSFEPTTLAMMIVAIAIVRSLIIVADVTLQYTWVMMSNSMLRKNMFERVLQRPGARAVPSSPGEALSRFRDDVQEVAQTTTLIPFLVSDALFAGIAIFIMMQINPLITLVVIVPLFIVIWVATLFSERIVTYRKASLAATGEVTGFIGETFGVIQAVKVAAAEDRMLNHFQKLNDKRRAAALKDRLLNETLNSVYQNTVNLGTGIILLMAGQAMESNTFSVGDFALFVYYLGWVTRLITDTGIMLARYKQADVSHKRMQTLMQGAPPEQLVSGGKVYLSGELPEVPYYHKTDEDRLEVLEAENLTCAYPETGRGIENLNLRIKRGSFTVITGRIGSGKSTAIKVLIGLLPADSGEIRWNGNRVDDPASFFVPPRSAYTSQVPLLFSDTLKDNILMGLPEDKVNISEALQQAVLEFDLTQFPEGLNTVVGPKGVRLSGGQMQRSAAARMFVREAELLVFDDLSSALDVETESILWDRVFKRRDVTCLVVSHRRPALLRADHIIVLKDGKVEAEGKLDYLLEKCEEMQKLWHYDPHAEHS